MQLPDAARSDGLTDPTRSAILSASYVFANPGSIAGDAAAGAEVLARLEYLAVELDVGPRWIGMEKDLRRLEKPALTRNYDMRSEMFFPRAGAWRNCSSALDPLGPYLPESFVGRFANG